MTAPKPVRPLMRIPPPVMFVVTFFAGVGLQHLARLAFRPAPFLALLGYGLAGAAALLALSSVGIFLAARTTIVPFSAASKLVTWGPYRLTRNPMYVSLALAYLGAAMILTQVVALILLPLPIILVHIIVIPFEEGRMRELFGAAYDHYCAEVRRWL